MTEKQTHNAIRIETDRLILRRFWKHDIEDFMEYDSHPDLARFRSGDPYTEDQARECLATQRDLILGTERVWLSLAVELKAEGKMIGLVSIKVLNKLHHQGEIGWTFHPSYQRQGFATEASRAILQLGFGILDLHRITARCDVLNTRSLRLMERLGMRGEALFREIVFFKGVWHDQYTYAILKEEWEKQEDVSS